MNANSKATVLSEIEIDEVSGGGFSELWDDVKQAWHNFWCCDPEH